MNKYNKIFKDSYGIDRLSKYLLAIGVVFLISRITLFPGIVLIIYAAWRAISKNKYKRYQELQAFDHVFEIIRQKFYRIKYKFNEYRQYKVFKCPECSQKLRVPRKKGKITITCKNCNKKFKGRT
ncbi:hypothetical protein SAMN02745134_02370 [Clostridium acidisoli DSM 12555]|uniref:Zn-finger containing protein n=1 Tax=Clostridium acidisoli DSM 12555 TaxID=1121291 RepID=A0A1W1XME1_9CLOT|nr:hypothetical protein [Clostridium acidisoli]SMC25123.1 hypothetical protein SAMN02745134_02370 [Clostridium acidisoli DSM 12555]